MRHLFPVDKPYVIAFNPADYRKNAQRIIQAFAQASRDSSFDANIQLLFVNQLPEAVKEKFDRLSAEYGIKNRIHYAGRISKSQLLRLYNGAKGLVFPSLYEGVGLPALEAMQCGTPVLTSNSSSMPEIVGNAAIQVDPQDVKGIAQGMVELVSNAALRKELTDRGFKQAARFQWTAVAHRTAAKLRDLMLQAPRLKSLMESPLINKELDDALEQIMVNLDEKYEQDKESLMKELRSELRNNVAELYPYIDRMIEEMTKGLRQKNPSITTNVRSSHRRRSSKSRNKHRRRSKNRSTKSKRTRSKRRRA
ncbi:glycosyltransferase family 4 protein [Cohnella yongneupensis]|uniref:Glycosyltransferase family 4 protein n=1 Tax=Cohnella yongneupensis TaxID=425006 RepID=A0ABW0R262_9BACL